MGINNWPKQERPRERLLAHGAHSLTDAELVAIVLKSGHRQTNAIALGRILLKKFGSLGALFTANSEQLQNINGLGIAKTALILTLREIHNRITREKVMRTPIISSTTDLVHIFTTIYAQTTTECIYTVFLNRKHEILEMTRMSEGTSSHVTLSPHKLFQDALRFNASAIILAHNHTGHTLFPSNEDMHMTKTLIQWGAILRIPLVDHIIINGEKYFSFSEEGLIHYFETQDQKETAIPL